MSASRTEERWFVSTLNDLGAERRVLAGKPIGSNRPVALFATAEDAKEAVDAHNARLKAKGPASAATDPDHGSTIPAEETAMNRPNDATRPVDPASEDAPTTEWLASMSFEPWVQDGTVPAPPTNMEWTELGAEYLPTVRIAYLSMFKSKDELVAMCREEPEMFMTLVDSEQDICEWFKCFVAILEGSYARYMSALAVVADDNWEAA